MRRAASTRFCLLLVLILLTTSFAFGQTAKPDPSTIDRGEAERDNPAARLTWFMEGRRTPDGKAPAEWMNRAMGQKFQLRSLREQQMRRMLQTLPSGQLSGITVGNGSTVWTPLGPAPIEPDPAEGVNWNEISGRVSAIAVDPSDTSGNTVYVGGATGGVWKSTNAAAADPRAVLWTPIIDQQQTLAVGAIAVSSDGNTVLVGTGEAKSAIDSYYGQGILRSTDRGITWTLIPGGGGFTFKGLGFAKIAFGAGNTVVASTSVGGFSQAEGAFPPGSWVGLWASSDGGATWAPASNVQDGGSLISISPFTVSDSVIYNPSTAKFYATIRFHGVYQSSDGIAWTRLPIQPDNTSLSLSNCPSIGSSACPMGRGMLAIRSGKNEMYFWYVDRNGTSAVNNHGVFASIDGGANWTPLDKTGIDTCPSTIANGKTVFEGGCSVAQGYFYNMAIAAAPNPGNTALTDVYVGAVNIFKCTLNPASLSTSHCQSTNPEPNKFMNITHVYGLGSCGFGGFAQLHPDQHAIEPSGISTLIYFGNDGGVYRTRNPAALNTANCAAAGLPLPYESLNANIGAMTQFVWATPHPTDPTGFIAGAQDNATTMTSSTIAGTVSTPNGKNFFPFAGGDGGYNAIRTDLGGSIFYSSFTQAQIFTCSNGFSCTVVDNRVVDNSELVAPGTTSGDNSAFYTPWVLDPYDPSQLILGSCRVWRGISTPGPTQTYNGVILSQKLGNNVPGSLSCASGTTNATTDPTVSALAVGGPKGAASGVTTGAARVIYAATYPSSSIWMTANADTQSTWSSISPITLNPNGYKISSLTIDQAGDATGMTVYATIQGFGGAHVIKSINGGTAWTDITGNLPDAPANTLVIDPDDHTVIYVGTDTGVYVTTNNGAAWTEVGPTLPGPVGASGFLPNVPISHLAFSTAGGQKQLMAATYGRGIWLADLTNTNIPQVSFDQTSLIFGSLLVNTTSTPQALKLTNTGAGDMTITNIAIGGTNPTSFAISSDNCPRSPSTLAVAASCTINVTATPKSAGPLNGAVTVTDNAPGSPHSVPLTVTGTTPGVNLDKTTLTFTSQMIGSTSAGQDVTVTNNGTGPLTFTSITFTGTNAASFSQTNTCPVSPATLAAAANCKITVKFTPAAVGTLAATNLSIADSATGSPQTLALSGTGTGSSYTATPSPLAFGTVAIGATPTLFVTINNTGTGQMTFAAATAAPYSTNGGTCGATINAGANCTVGVKYTPSAPAGAQNGTLTFTTNGAGPATVPITGTSTTAVLNVVPNPAAFGNQLINTASTAKLVTVTNATSNAISITTLDITGTNSSEFSKDAGCVGAPLAASANCTLNITFTPTATGARAAVLTIHATGQPDTTVNLTGTGTQPGILFAPAGPIAFNNQRVGTTSAAQNVTLTNNGTADLHITAISVPAPYVLGLNTCAGLPKTLTANASCIVQIQFAPTVTGPTAGANLSVTDDAPASPQLVQLTGTGTQSIATITGGPLTFTALNIGQTSTAQTITVKNTGTDTLNIGAITATGQFVTTADTCSAKVIAVNTTCTIGVQFKPTTTGPQAGQLNIPSDAPTSIDHVALSGTGTAPTVTLTPPAPMNFPNTVVSQTSAGQDITVTNSGTGPLTVSAVTITGTNAGDFSQTNTCSAVIAAGAFCKVTVTFHPAATGARAATVNIADDAAGSPQLYSVTGTGTGPAVELDIAGVASTTLAFGNQRKGVQSLEKLFQVKNTGTADLHVSSVLPGGTNVTDFAISTNTCTVAVAPGTSCNVGVKFNPGAIGARTGTVVITSDATPTTATMNLTGTGIFPAITTAPPANLLDYATVKVNTVTATQTFTLTNTGTDTLNISASVVTAAAYNVTNNCGVQAIPVNGTCTIIVAFAPTATGAAAGTIVITHDVGTTTLNLTGTGALPLGSPAPTSLTFTAQKVGTTSTAQVITFTNNSPVQMAGITVTKGGASPTQYGLTTTCGLTLAANANCTASVTFAPTAVGTPAANVTFTHDGSNSPTVVAVTGTAEVPAVTPAPTVAAGVVFNGKPITSSSTATVTLTNTSHVPLAINSVSIPAGGAFTQTNTCGTSVAGQANCVITVTFAPTTTGVKNGTLTVTTDAAAPNNSMAFSLSGTGEDFTQSTGSSAVTVTAGNPASFTMTETPAGGSFTNPITFSCTGQDATMGCSFSPAQVTPGAAAATTTVTITTKKGGSTMPVLRGSAKPRSNGSPLLAFWLALPGMAVLFPVVGSRKLGWTRKLGLMVMLLFVLVMVLSMAGCGGGSPGTAVGPHTVNVVATSGALSHTTQVTVTVQ